MIAWQNHEYFTFVLGRGSPKWSNGKASHKSIHSHQIPLTPMVAIDTSKIRKYCGYHFDILVVLLSMKNVPGNHVSVQWITVYFTWTLILWWKVEIKPINHYGTTHVLPTSLVVNTCTYLLYILTSKTIATYRSMVNGLICIWLKRKIYFMDLSKDMHTH